MPRRVADAGEDARSGEEPRESFDVRFWKVRSYKGARGQTYTVRWTVAGRTHPETFKTRALADGRLAELRTHARNGAPFDVAMPEVRGLDAQALPREPGAGWVGTWDELGRVPAAVEIQLLDGAGRLAGPSILVATSQGALR